MLLKLKATSKHVKGVDNSQEPHRIGKKDNSDGKGILVGLLIYTRYVGAQIDSSAIKCITVHKGPFDIQSST